MKFKELDIVKVTKNCEKGIKIGDIGTVLIAFRSPYEAYEVEFLDENGYPKAQCTLLPDMLELVKL